MARKVLTRELDVSEIPVSAAYRAALRADRFEWGRAVPLVLVVAAATIGVGAQLFAGSLLLVAIGAGLLSLAVGGLAYAVWACVRERDVTAESFYRARGVGWTQEIRGRFTVRRVVKVDKPRGLDPTWYAPVDCPDLDKQRLVIDYTRGGRLLAIRTEAGEPLFRLPGYEPP